MSTKEGTERGSVLIIAVIGMLILGILSVSFSLLASVETKIGVNYKHQQQARVLAEAGLAFARDAVSTAAQSAGGFTGWLSSPAVHILAGTSDTIGRALDPGQFWARIDNDCDTIADESGTAGSAQIVPPAIREADHLVAGVPTACNNTGDFNTTAVLTAWATVGTGNSTARARIRAIIGADDPWKHVCSSATANGTCTDPINQSGSPTITPSDPGAPNGPRTYPTLPQPALGCSTIDPTMHGNDEAGCAANTGRMVVTGDATRMNCNGGTQNYAGFFDCALTTPCDTTTDACPNNTPRDACVRGGPGVPNTDTRAGTVVGTAQYVASVIVVGGVYRCPNQGPTGNPVTGMVFNNYENTQVVPNRLLSQTPVITVNIDSSGNKRVGCIGIPVGSGVCTGGIIVGRTIYVMRASTTPAASGRMAVKSTGGGDTVVYGTIVVEGGGIPEACPGSSSDFVADTNTQVHTVANPTGTAYGYPLVLLAYDPQQPPPTSSTRQQICADLGAGGGNTQIDGLVYSSGKVQFNPLTLNGGVVAYDVETQGSAVYTYNSTYGSAAPPPGFSPTAGASIAILRKSFVTCTNYSVNSSATDYPAPSRCN